MEIGIKSPVRSPSPSSHPLSPTGGSRLAKLPPIPSDASSVGSEGERFYATPALMQTACTELKVSMGHLLNEVSIAKH